MIFKISLFLLSTLLLSFNWIDPDCLKSIKTGQFKYIGDTDNILFRNEKQQIETFNNGFSTVISDISWINDREYILTVKETTNCPDSEFSKRGTQIRVKILECSNTSYTCSIDYGKGQVINAGYSIIIDN